VLDSERGSLKGVNLLPHGLKQEDCIMCCCCKEIPHDESMKFKMHFNKDVVDVYSLKLFENKPIGELIDINAENTNKIKIPGSIDQ
jgi:hypothetical protein